MIESAFDDIICSDQQKGYDRLLRVPGWSCPGFDGSGNYRHVHATIVYVSLVLEVVLESGILPVNGQDVSDAVGLEALLILCSLLFPVVGNTGGR